MKRLSRLQAPAVAGLWLATATLAFCQSPAGNPKPADDLDRQRLENLGAGAEDAKLLEELGLAAIPEEQAPLVQISQKMQDVAALLARTEAGPQTQQLQREVLDGLDKMIKAVRQQCRRQPGPASPQAGNGGSQGDQQRSPGEPGNGKPNGEPGNGGSAHKQPGDGGPPDMAHLQSLVREAWGSLPERVRQQMSEISAESYLPKYELMIEQYFRRLAEEDQEP